MKKSKEMTDPKFLDFYKLHPYHLKKIIDAFNIKSFEDLLNIKGKRIKFEYDFGDSWEHDVWMKAVSDYTDEHQPGLYLVKAEGACPPEDCGGVWGYANLLELKNKNRKTREEKDRLEWYGIDKYYDEHDPNEEELTSSLENLWNEATE